MRNFSKVVTSVCIVLGALAAQPAKATYEYCNVQGGYHYQNFPCPNAPLPNGTYLPCDGATCGVKRWLKGDYCTPAEQVIFCIDLAPTQTPVEQTTSQCGRVVPPVVNPTYDCECAWGDPLARPWAPTGATENQGQCMDFQ